MVFCVSKLYGLAAAAVLKMDVVPLPLLVVMAILFRSRVHSELISVKSAVMQIDGGHHDGRGQVALNCDNMFGQKGQKSQIPPHPNRQKT